MNETQQSLFCRLRIDLYLCKSEESQLGHYATAIRAALNQTGTEKKDIHGLSITTQASPDTAPHVAEQLGFELDWVLNADYGGAGGVGAVRRAADAIECGHLDVALLVGGNSFDRTVAHQRPLEYQRGNFVDVYGYGGPNSSDGADPTACTWKTSARPWSRSARSPWRSASTRSTIRRRCFASRCRCRIISIRG